MYNWLFVVCEWGKIGKKYLKEPQFSENLRVILLNVPILEKL